MINRNQNSRFSMNPQADIQRSRFKRNQNILFTANAGELIPFYCDEVLPGDTKSINTHKLFRMQTLATPVMGDIYADIYYFFVPNRLVWDHWREFMGENTSAPWAQTVDYEVPYCQAPKNESSSYGTGGTGFPIGSIGDYLGIPVGVEGLQFNALPTRAYTLIWNEWFRDQNLQSPQYIYTGDNFTWCVVEPSNPLEQGMRCAKPLPVSKFHDYFTSCLPSPQKGPDVLLPLGQYAPVVTGIGDNNGLVDRSLFPETSTLAGMKYYQMFPDSEGFAPEGNLYVGSNGNVSVDGADPVTTSNSSTIAPANLWTDLQAATSASINQLRLAFQIQKIYERDARGGTRYISLLKAHFGVTSPDSRLQRPEYLGGNRMAVNVNQVVQQSESATTPQGTTTAYSLTVDSHSDFTQSFVEHGYIIGVLCFRYSHIYQQGLERFWSRKNRFDFYWPLLANIGEQPVYRKEIYADGSADDDLVFGYQEPWADYRYKPNRVCGEMRSQAQATLDAWHLADNYSSAPTLSSDWIKEDKAMIDRALAVTSDTAMQFFGDILVESIDTRPMPLFSIPGFIDHH